jgi:hypothetical protein
VPTPMKRLLLTLFVLIALPAAGWLGWRWASTSDRFAIKDVIVTGNSRVTHEEILRLARVQTPNIFRLSIRDVEERLARHPWIASVSVSRRLPDKLAVRVIERQAACVALLDGVLYLTERDGRPFKRAAIETGEADGLTVVSGIDRRLFAADPQRAATLVVRALGIAEAWRMGPERPPIGEVHLSTNGVRLYTLEGAVAIELGRATSATPKENDVFLEAGMSRFDAVWSVLSPEERAAARTIHLDSRTRQDRVTVSQRSSASK